jgi:Sulfotransferase family
METPSSFDQKACFIAGPDKSGTTLMCSLLDWHPELATFPEETNYLRSVVPRLGCKPRSEQVDYLVRKGPSRMLFIPPTELGNSYPGFPKNRFLSAFSDAAVRPEHTGRDLLGLMIEEYTRALERDPGEVVRWVEKTPDNACCFPRIRRLYPKAKVLVMMRDPRAVFAAYLELSRKTGKPFKAFNPIRGWLQTAALLRSGDPLLGNSMTVRFEELASNPEPVTRAVAEFLAIRWDPILLQPTKMGQGWGGNSASLSTFDGIDKTPVDRWRSVLTPGEIAWVESHCREDMERLGYQCCTPRSKLPLWFGKLPEESLGSFFKSRGLSMAEKLLKRFSRKPSCTPKD